MQDSTFGNIIYQNDEARMRSFNLHIMTQTLDHLTDKVSLLDPWVMGMILEPLLDPWVTVC
jgi:hypothetical protein